MTNSLFPIILIHGFIGSLEPFTQVGALASRTVYAPPLAGYGANTASAPADIALDAQAEQIKRLIEKCFGETPVHIVGHSVGGMIAMLSADKMPERVASVISIEGNFSLADAFWSGGFGRMTSQEACATLEALQSDPKGWLLKSGIIADDALLQMARHQLSQQTSETLRLMGQSVVSVTNSESWDKITRSVFSKCKVHLVAGQRSVSGWNLPEWARDRAASYTEMSSVGHMMMIEKPDEFGNLIHDLTAVS